MKRVNEKFTLGKLKHEYLAKLLSEIDIQDNRVIIGSKIGEDAAVIDMPGNNYLVAKIDPITFAADEIGYYAVIVNVNDIVCTGAKPKWFQATILLPASLTTRNMIETIFNDIHRTCKSMEITVIGGHTEVTPGLTRPIVIGSLIGEVEKNKLVYTSGAESGDALILTKGIFIEGTAIIGREKEKEIIKRGYDQDFISKCKHYLYNPGISVFEEALLANKHFKIKSMHDPTEGGLYTGIAEMTIASNTGVMIDEMKIRVLPEPLELSRIFKLNPLNTISSGTLLIAIEEDTSNELIELLKRNNIYAEKIGNFVSKESGLKIKNKEGRILPLEYSETDEITKLF
ncbi:MAG: AIR synthase family protein [Candidatus Odinarchaeota archaeon]